MHVTGRSYFESARLLKSKEQDLDIQDQLLKTLTVKPDYVAYDAEMLKRLSDSCLQSSRSLDYLQSRKITKDSISYFMLGYSEKQDMITIPVHAPDGTPVGFVARSVAGKDFKNTPGLPKSKVLFNLHRVKNDSYVYVVESSFDAIRLHQCGMSAVATLGANVSNFQIDLLKKYFNNIIVVADNDAAGGNMKNKILESLGSRVSVVQLNKQYKDIGDMEDDDIKNIRVSFDTSIMSMLQ
jgi:DNA primase